MKSKRQTYAIEKKNTKRTENKSSKMQYTNSTTEQIRRCEATGKPMPYIKKHGKNGEQKFKEATHKQCNSAH